MTDLRKAAEMALAKLEHLWDIGIDAEYKVKLLPEIEALRQALAQPEQGCAECGKKASNGWALYCVKCVEQEPTEWKSMVVANLVSNGINKHKARELADYFYIPPSSKQEPVAYLCENAVGYKYFRWKKPTSHYKPIALYTAPPSKPWVSLTDEEIMAIIFDAKITEPNDEPIKFGAPSRQCIKDLVSYVQAKLRERNT